MSIQPETKRVPNSFYREASKLIREILSTRKEKASGGGSHP